MRISIVIPLYESERTIGKVLESILSLNYDKKKIELILVYYPSNDKTIDTVKDFVEKHRAFFYDIRIITRHDKRANVARNLGIKESRGRYVFLLNDDIILLPNTLKNATEIFINDPSIGVFTFPYILEPPRIFEEAMFFRFLGKVKKTKVFGLGCSIVKREVFEKAGLINEHLGPPVTSNDDYEISARVARAGYKVVIDGRIVLKDIGNVKVNINTNVTTLLSRQEAMIKRIFRVLLKYVYYDFTTGADTYRLVLKSAPISWKLEATIYLAMPLLFLYLLLLQPVLALMYLATLSAVMVLYYQVFMLRYILYSYLLVLRRISRVYGHVIRGLYLAVRDMRARTKIA